jgi:uncharacterized protein (TIGR02466 family)
MHKLFVTQVYQAKIKLDLADLKKEILQIQKVDHLGQKWSKKNYASGYTSYGSWDQLHKMSSSFLEIEKKINTHVNKFCKASGFNISKKALKMNTIWVNIMPKGAFHTSHIHPQSVISGTLYVDMPAQASAIKFEDPRLGLLMNAPQVKPNSAKSNAHFFEISPKAGDLILFESWLKHEVPLNQSRSPRISISFNYDWA